MSRFYHIQNQNRYTVNYQSAEDLTYGRGTGCEMFTQKCTAWTSPGYEKCPTLTDPTAERVCFPLVICYKVETHFYLFYFFFKKKKQ